MFSLPLGPPPQLTRLLAPLSGSAAAGLPLGQPWSVAVFASPTAAAHAAAALDGQVHQGQRGPRCLVTALANPAHPRVARWVTEAAPLCSAAAADHAAASALLRRGALPWLPPGAHLQHDFVSEAEADALLAALPPRAEMTRLRQRSVTHYGRAYDYEAFALKAEPAAPWPPLVRELLASRLADAVAAVACTNLEDTSTSNTSRSQRPELTQLTVNAYSPGDGIAPHVDAPQAFGEHVAILSLGMGGVTMDFSRLLEDDITIAAASAKDSTHSSSGGRLAAAATSHLHRQRARLAVEGGHVPPPQQRSVASVYLPPRSLLHLSGEVRYGWTHAIAPRATDVVDGKVCPRGERVSLTFRSVGKG